MNFFKPPYRKLHIIIFGSLTFFLGIALLFILDNNVLNNQSPQDSVEVTQTTASKLRQDHTAGVELLDIGNEVGALLVGNLMVVDIRPAEEFDQGHLQGAHNIAIDDLKNTLFIDTTNVVLYATDKSLLEQAIQAMQGKEVASVQTLNSSLQELESAGYTIIKE